MAEEIIFHDHTNEMVKDTLKKCSLSVPNFFYIVEILLHNPIYILIFFTYYHSPSVTHVI